MPKRKDETHISSYDAAKILGIDPGTVKAWVEKGKLPGRIDKGARDKIYVLASAVKGPYKPTCLLCGKPIKAKNIAGAKYCCDKHKHAYLYRQRKAKHHKNKPQTAN